MFLQNFAQSAGECTVNGQPVDCGEAAQAAGGIIAGFGIFMLLLFVFGIFSTIIWILSLIHLIQHEDVENRMIWIILVFLVPLANFVYYFGFRRSYQKQKSGNPQNQSASPSTPGSTPGAVAPKDSSDNNAATGAVVGGATAASSGLSDNSPVSSPDLTATDSSGQQPSTDIGLEDSSIDVAQADSASEYPSEESSPGTSGETTETVSPSDAESYQSGSTDDAQAPAEEPSASQPEPSSGGDSTTENNDSDDQNLGGTAGPTFG